MNKNRSMLAMLLVVTIGLFSCVSGPQITYVEDYNEKGSGYDINIQIDNISEDEYNYFISQLETGRGYRLTERHLSGNRADFVYHVNSLDVLALLQKDIEGLQVVYSDSEVMESMFEYKEYFRQYVFSKDISAGSGAQYPIQVTFSPNSSINIGGHDTFSNSSGTAQFNGIGLDLGNAVNGQIFIVDSLGNRVEANLSDDGKWYIRAVGEVLGEEIEKMIEVEALR